MKRGIEFTKNRTIAKLFYFRSGGSYNFQIQYMNTPSHELTLFLSSYPGKVQQLVSDMRQQLISLLPGIKETLDASAKIIGYGYGPKYADMVCSIILSQKGIKLGLYKGSELPDPKGLLTGAGKVHKHIVINTEKDVHCAAVKDLIEEGYRSYLRRKGV
jgi:hypothetical protein